ncbi:three-helix bundle dimerization domain-containing protein [Streptomyces sp. NPDC088253]|uniref:three-helix bundle dimerization domain-containing protein n=1 Tax=Streptomyces sp. NPDC088253 TaxID=3365846 RepID=UPI0037F66CF8
MITKTWRFRMAIPAEAEEHIFRAGDDVAVETREEEAIRGVVERLTSAYDKTCTPEQVEAAVAAAHADFSERPVRDFVPVLVERKARAVLNEASG